MRFSIVSAKIFLVSCLIFGLGAETVTAAVISTDQVTELHNLVTKSDDSIRYRLDYFLNKYGDRELQVSLIESHWLAKDTTIVVLRGRDLDSDGLIETWFYTDGAVIRSFRKKPESADAWPVVSEILNKHSMDEARWISTLIAREIITRLSVTIDGELQDMKKLEEQQIDLMDLDYKIADLEIKSPDSAVLNDLKHLSDKSWLAYVHQITSGAVEDRTKRAMGDVALAMAGNAALRGVKFLAVKSLGSEMLTGIKINLGKILSQKTFTVEKINSKVIAATPLIHAKIAKPTVTAFRSVAEALRWFGSGKIFHSKFVKEAGHYLKAIKGNLAYTAMSETIQLAVESFEAGYWTPSDMPLILDHPVQSVKDFGTQVINNEHILQNMGYMTLQTTFNASAYDRLKENGYGFKARYATSAAVTLVDATTVNIFILRKDDYKRLAFDTGWELSIGISQILLDKFFEEKSEHFADKFKNKKLVYVGWMLKAINQSLGYIAYSKTTHHLFGHSKPEEKEHDKKEQGPLPVVVVPVYAPAG